MKNTTSVISLKQEKRKFSYVNITQTYNVSIKQQTAIQIALIVQVLRQRNQLITLYIDVLINSSVFFGGSEILY